MKQVEEQRTKTFQSEVKNTGIVIKVVPYRGIWIETRKTPAFVPLSGRIL